MLKNYLTRLWHQAAERNNQLFESFLEPDNQARVLDLGVDSGIKCKERVERVIKTNQVYGVDLDDKCLESCKRLGIKPVKHNLNEKFPFKSRFFDCVTANQIIEHLDNTDLFLEECYRVLKPGGYMVIATENMSSWHNIGALVWGYQAFSQDISDKLRPGNPLTLSLTNKAPAHRRIFTAYGLKKLLEYYKFKVEAVAGAGYYPFPRLIARMLADLDKVHTAFIIIKVRKPGK